MIVSQMYQRNRILPFLPPRYYYRWRMQCDGKTCYRFVETDDYIELGEKAESEGWLILNVPQASAQWHYCPDCKGNVPKIPEPGDTQFHEEGGVPKLDTFDEKGE